MLRVLFVIFLLLVQACSPSPTRLSDRHNQASLTATAPRLQSNLSAEYSQAMTLASEQRWQQAEQILSRLTAQSARLPWNVHANHGVTLLKLKQYERAESAFRRALSVQPEPGVYNYLGLLYRETGRFPEAEQAYQSALKIDSRYAPAYRNLAILYELFLQDYAKARRYYQQYAQLQPAQKDQVQAWLKVMEQNAQVSNQ